MNNFQTSSYFARFLLSSIRKYCRECEIKSLEGSGKIVESRKVRTLTVTRRALPSPMAAVGEDLSGFGADVGMEVDLVGRQALEQRGAC